MILPLYLAMRNLLRNPARNLLYVLGISITAALLLDMMLLSGGLNTSLKKILNEMGYEVRISPRGTLPFETDAQITSFHKIAKRLQQLGTIQSIDAMLGTSLTAEFQTQSFSTFVLGIDQRKAVLYTLVDGSDPSPGKAEVLVNDYLANAKGIRPGDTLQIRPPSQNRTLGSVESVPLKVSGIGKFYLDAEGQYTVSCSLSLLQEILGQKQEDPVSAILLKLHDAHAADQTAAAINAAFPQVSAYTIKTVIDEVDRQLSYFKQFAYILGGISLVVTFVLILIIATISFHDRVGEIALLKAIGLSKTTVFLTILLEGILTSIAASAFGFLLGKAVAYYLDRILTSAPGLPEDFSFFIMQPAAILRGVATLLLTGFIAGLYPASAAISLPVAETLREEIL